MHTSVIISDRVQPTNYSRQAGRGSSECYSDKLAKNNIELSLMQHREDRTARRTAHERADVMYAPQGDEAGAVACPAAAQHRDSKVCVCGAGGLLFQVRLCGRRRGGFPSLSRPVGGARMLHDSTTHNISVRPASSRGGWPPCPMCRRCCSAVMRLAPAESSQYKVAPTPCGTLSQAAAIGARPICSP